MPAEIAVEAMPDSALLDELMCRPVVDRSSVASGAIRPAAQTLTKSDGTPPPSRIVSQLPSTWQAAR
jgi:hypothetical protein